MTTYTSGKRVFFGILAPPCFLVAAIFIADLSRIQASEDYLESLLVAAAACGLAIVAVKIAITGTSWGWFERAGGFREARRLAFWLLPILASVSLFLRSTSLRQRAWRPQLKRDPLGR